jgi:hypothetical protein
LRTQIANHSTAQRISAPGHSRPNWAIRLMSGLLLIATELRTSLEVRFVPERQYDHWCSPVVGHWLGIQVVGYDPTLFACIVAL